jgi:predicted dehydrogenase
MTASLKDAEKIFKAAVKSKVPVFSSSSLRYVSNVQQAANGAKGKVLGAETFSPCPYEKTHPDLFWYGIHGVEMLFTVMGTGCQTVTRYHTAGTDVVVGTWKDGRIGTFRGIRSGKADYGGKAYCEQAIMELGPYQGYDPLLLEIARFFQTGQAPVRAEETLEILAFMEAADESKRNGGTAVRIKV